MTPDVKTFWFIVVAFTTAAVLMLILTVGQAMLR
jgi:hypothetical protein